VHIVLGAAAESVRERADLSGCAVTVNPDWAEGMGSSLRAGLESLAGTGPGTATGARAVVVALVDQPGIGAAAVARVVAAYRSPASLASAAYDGKRGHPVLLGAEHWRGVAANAVGDQGARAYLQQHESEIRLVECGDVADPADIDTPDDLRLLRTIHETRAPRATKY
jgi:nicotine blue oxidoreductase